MFYYFTTRGASCASVVTVVYELYLRRMLFPSDPLDPELNAIVTDLTLAYKADMSWVIDLLPAY